MAVFAGQLVPWIELRFLDLNGEPLAGGFVHSYVAGTSTPQDTYTDADLLIANTNPIELDANGRCDAFFLAAAGYKFIVTDVNAVAQYTIDQVQNVGQVFAATLGTVLSDGSKNVTSGYAVLTTDHLVTVDSTGGPNPCVINLPQVSTASQPVSIKNLGTVALSIAPYAGDTIEGLAAAYSVAAAVSPAFPTVVMVPDGTNGWFIYASHAL
jgi:hypothetical protein